MKISKLLQNIKKYKGLERRIKKIEKAKEPFQRFDFLESYNIGQGLVSEISEDVVSVFEKHIKELRAEQDLLETGG